MNTKSDGVILFIIVVMVQTRVMYHYQKHTRLSSTNRTRTHRLSYYFYTLRCGNCLLLQCYCLTFRLCGKRSMCARTWVWKMWECVCLVWLSYCTFEKIWEGVRLRVFHTCKIALCLLPSASFISACLVPSESWLQRIRTRVFVQRTLEKKKSKREIERGWNRNTQHKIHSHT